MKIQYCFINTEFFSSNGKKVPIGTVLKYEEYPAPPNLGTIWIIGPYNGTEHWSYPMKEGTPDFEIYAYVKEYITIINMDKPLCRLLFL